MIRPVYTIPYLLIMLSMVFSACGERTDEPAPDVQREEEALHIPDAVEAAYRHSSLGFAISDKTEWEIQESTDRQDEKHMVLINLTKDGERVDIRAVDGEWQGLMPLVRLDQRARDAQQEIHIGGVQGLRTHLQRFGDDYVRIEKNDVIYEITGKPEIVDAVLDELIWFEPVSVEPERIEVQRVRQRDLPQPVRQWADNLMQLDMMPMAETMTYDSKQYVFATWGTRPTGGYDVRIREAVTRNGTLYVQLEYTRPGPDEMVTQAITHPFDIAVIDEPFEQVEFEKARREVPRTLARIRGIDDIKKIQAGSRSIKVFTPEPGSEVSDPVKITGIANVHEANVEYRVLDEDAQSIKSGFTTAAAAYEWGYYELEVSVGERLQAGDSFTVELFYTDMKDGERRDIVTIPLQMR